MSRKNWDGDRIELGKSERGKGDTKRLRLRRKLFTGYKIVAKRAKIGSAKSNEKCEIEHKIHNNTHSKIKKKKQRK